jgi:ATP-dependent RNA circularization protein (DNA/RNA ligase family)
LGGTISFAYIDGNHTYDFAKRDFENADKYLEVGGVILFDDSSDDSIWEVNKVIEEIKKEGRYEIIIKNPNYLIKKIR